MAKVLGLGGVFFKSKDPEKLGKWYQDALQMPVDPPYGANMSFKHMPPDALSVWAPFKQDTHYFNPSKQPFMINLIVDDVRQALQQVQQAGAELIDDVVEEEYGIFGWFMDPEGNKVELWQPATPEIKK